MKQFYECLFEKIVEIFLLLASKIGHVSLAVKIFLILQLSIIKF